MFPTTFAAPDGLPLYCHTMFPIAGTPQANIIVIHGLGDHSQSLPYRNLGDYLTAHNLAAFSFDFRGHGRSAGPRMFISAWQNLRTDLDTFVRLVQQTIPDKPLFLIGLSLGGLLALNYAQHHPTRLAGVVAAAPAIDASGVPPLIKLIVPLLARIMPMGKLNPRLDLRRISRDTAAVQEYTSDPLFQAKTTPRLAAEVLVGMVETSKAAAQLQLPLLILHGMGDTIVRPAGSAAFFDRVGSPNKTRLTYESAYHNLWLEPQRQAIFADIVGWVKLTC